MRLFFGLEIGAPWPEEFPEGRLIAEENRHITLAFLGEEEPERLLRSMDGLPNPSFQLGAAALFDAPLFLPHAHPRVAAWHITLLEGQSELLAFQQALCGWLGALGYSLKRSSGLFLPHVTIARRPFSIRAWKGSFAVLPLYIKGIHLWESLGESRYRSLWNRQFLRPFEELEHTADLAFLVRGKDWAQLFLHAALALAFRDPSLAKALYPEAPSSWEEVVRFLNRWIARIDAEEGCPFKAVSWHGDVRKDHCLEWEMIVDV